jgi:hypothetical protein
MFSRVQTEYLQEPDLKQEPRGKHRGIDQDDFVEKIGPLDGGIEGENASQAVADTGNFFKSAFAPRRKILDPRDQVIGQLGPIPQPPARRVAPKGAREGGNDVKIPQQGLDGLLVGLRGKTIGMG